MTAKSTPVGTSLTEVPVDTETFATGLREGLRQKPDILMVARSATTTPPRP